MVCFKTLTANFFASKTFIFSTYSDFKAKKMTNSRIHSSRVALHLRGVSIAPGIALTLAP